jgi:hypothetical protein
MSLKIEMWNPKKWLHILIFILEIDFSSIEENEDWTSGLTSLASGPAISVLTALIKWKQQLMAYPKYVPIQKHNFGIE